MPIELWGATFDPPDPAEWELERVAVGGALWCVSKAMPWHQAENLLDLRAHFLAEYPARFSHALREWFQSIEPPDFTPLARIQPMTFWLRNYLCAGNLEMRRNRRQAMSLFPIFTPSLAGRRKPDARTQALGALIDEGRPLIEGTARIYGVKREVIRALRDLETDCAGILSGEDCAATIKLLSWVPPEKRPHTTGDWHMFRTLLRGVRVIWPRLENCHWLGVWIRQISRRGFGAEGLRALQRLASHGAAQEMADFLEALSQGLQWELNQNASVSDAVREVVNDAVSSVSVTRLLSFSRAWHECYLEAEAEAANTLDEAAGRRWESFVAQPMTFGGRQIVPLLTELELEAEGRALRHCVGSYGIRAWGSMSFLFSVRDERGVRKSTFELSLDDELDPNSRTEAPMLRVTQHSALKNAEPSAACRDAVEMFLKNVVEQQPPERMVNIARNRTLHTAAMKQYRGHDIRAKVTVKSLRRVLCSRLDFDRLLSAASMRIQSRS